MAQTGLPHYRSSKASMKNEEPIYGNLFEVKLILPSAIRAGSDVILEHVTKIEGLDMDKGLETETQAYKFAKRTYLKSGPEDTTTKEIKIGFNLNLNDANEFYVYKILRNWWRLAYNPLTGEQGLKKDYSGDAAIIVTNYNRKGDIFWQRTFHAIIPLGTLPEIKGDYESGEIIKDFEVGFSSDWWEENIV
jgi:hypothetical protein